MDINFANEIIEKLNKNGYETKHWISKDKGGRTVVTTAEDLLDAFSRVADGTCRGCASANYHVIYNKFNEDDGDSIYIFKDYIEVIVPHDESR